MIDIPYLELLVTLQCNNNCDGCCVYSNYDHDRSTMIHQQDIFWDIRYAARTLNPKMVRIYGGEPMMHPDLPNIVKAIANVWPNADRYLVTNALLAPGFVRRHKDFAEILKTTNTKVQVSFHSSEPAYLEKMQPVLTVIGQWVKEHNIYVTIEDHRQFKRNYHGIGASMLPFNDENPRQSWEICLASQCLNLFKGRLWKCSPIAHLKTIATKFNLDLKEEWKPYLEYDGLDINSSEAEIRAFLDREDESICGMCPAKSQNLYYKNISNKNFHKVPAPYVGEQIDLALFLENILGDVVS